MTRAIKITSEAQANRALGAMRRNAGLRQTDLAEKLKTSPSTVRGRERNDRGLHVQALIATAKALGFDVVLIKRTEERP